VSIVALQMQILAPNPLPISILWHKVVPSVLAGEFTFRQKLEFFTGKSVQIFLGLSDYYARAIHSFMTKSKKKFGCV
jgi:hypothetical protein